MVLEPRRGADPECDEADDEVEEIEGQLEEIRVQVAKQLKYGTFQSCVDCPLEVLLTR